jgi:hypothetical protein
MSLRSRFFQSGEAISFFWKFKLRFFEIASSLLNLSLAPRKDELLKISRPEGLASKCVVWSLVRRDKFSLRTSCLLCDLCG